MSSMKNILIVVTSASQYQKAGYRTGLWLGELTHFYDVVEKAGFTSVIASTEGGQVPIDPESLAHEVLDELGAGERYADHNFMNKLADTPAVADIDAVDYEAVYLAGGHGCMFDFADHLPLAELIKDLYESGKVVSAVCHGPCGLLGVRLTDGTYLVEGKQVTGFTWEEEELAQRSDVVPYSLQDELKQRGADYRKADNPFAPYVHEDGMLITGQNPASAVGVAKAVVDRLG